MIENGVFEDADAGVDIASLRREMLAGRLSCVQLVERCLARIERWDRRGPALGAMLAVNPRALEMAADCDAALSRPGASIRPLHGIPVVLKDNIGTCDMPTTGGSKSLEGFTPTRDSTLARRLIDAGAIILGKANLHEFALSGLTISSLGGQTRNPYDLTRTPGGSSGGSAVAVAMGFCAVALGTDTVNSIRSPASATGLVGLRPTRGLVSRAGVLPVSDTQDVAGPIGRCVADVACVMDVLAGYDPDDPLTARSVGKTPPTYVDALDATALRGKRLGLLRGFQGTEARHAEVNLAVSRAVEAMRAGGAEVVPLEDPQLDADRLLREYDVQKWEFKAHFERYLHSQPDAPLRSLDDLIEGGLFHRESLEVFLIQAQDTTDIQRDPEYLARLVAIEGLRDRVFDHMAAQRLDALIYPLQKCLVAPIGSNGQPERNGILAALTGFPALNVPAGFSVATPQAPVGVPIGLDIIARPFEESLLLGLGYAYEQLAGCYRPPEHAGWEP